MSAPSVAWLVVGAVAAVMTGALAWGVAVGDLPIEAGALVSMPWGVVSLVEVYVGMSLFACWVFRREASPLRAGGWMLAAVVAGNVVSCVYVLLALKAADGDAQRFWMGSRTPGGEAS